MILCTEVGNFFVYLLYAFLITTCTVLHNFHLMNQRTEQFGLIGFQFDNHIGKDFIYGFFSHMAVLTVGCTR